MRLFVLLAWLTSSAWPRSETPAQTSVPRAVPPYATVEMPVEAGARLAGQAAGPAQRPGVLYVVRRSWHVDVGFDVEDLEPALAPVAARFPGVKYLLFGFGDRRYLLSKHHGPPVLIAALWPGPALVLVTALNAPPAAAFGETSVVRLSLSHDELRHAQEFVARELHDANTALAEGPYAGSLYYAARERYSGLHTCNTWAAADLAAAGLPLPYERIWFAGQLWRRVRRAAIDRGGPTRGAPPP